MFTRQRYQNGSFRKIKRKKGPPVWEFRYRDRSIPGNPQKAITLNTEEFPTEAAARRHVEALLWKVNEGSQQATLTELTFSGLCERFSEDEHLREISKLRAGQTNTFGTLKVSTAKSYVQIIDSHILPRWGEMFIAKVTAARVADWFKEMPRSPVTKAHIKALLYRLFEKAMLWELITVQRNPMELVEIRGSSKRAKRPLVLSIEQANTILGLLGQPYRTMVLVGLCTGLRVSEILALKWADIDFEQLEMNVCRAVVRGVVDDTKTECSADLLPLDADFAEKLQAWLGDCPPSADGWMFPSPITGRPYTPGVIQQKVIRKAGKKLGLDHVGWHTMRHTYRSMVEATGATIGVQQKLMRHADIATTSRYGNSFMETKRVANSKVVRMVLPSVNVVFRGSEQAGESLAQSS